jgi:glycosyltransferase involved in cell wall biosynthesis
MALANNHFPADVRVRSEAASLAELGLKVTVYAPKGPGEASVEVVEGITVRRFWLPEGQSATGLIVEYLVALLQLSVRLTVAILRGADVLHFHNPPDIFFPVGALARSMGRRVIFDHHDLAPELAKEKFGHHSVLSAPLRWCERMSMRCASVVISTNESYKEIAVERNGVRAEDVVVVRNAPQDRTLAAESSGRPGPLVDPRLCYVGALAVQDGGALLPQILSTLVRAHGLDPHLRIVGGGPAVEAIKALATQLQVADRIEWTGFVRHERVAQYIAESDVCLDVAPCSELNHKSTMIKIGEYMAGGRPIVTFPLEETMRTAGDCAVYAECGSVDDYAGQIARLSHDEEARSVMSSKALLRARDGTWSKSAVNLRRAYELALATR